MPPPEAHKTLKPDELATLRQWIAEGAIYEDHWAFLTPKRPTQPTLTGDAVTWARTPIDAFVAARLAREGLTPSAQADRRTLARRVTLDLTGILPTPEEVEAFAADSSPNAYTKVVDRLLASPRYGEHRARYWLDYARYGDTHGIHLDNYRSIWPYRDYVVRAFNANKPFDTFVREQLAGDLLPTRTIDGLAATGFVRCNLTTNEAGTIPEETHVNQTRDRVEAFGATFLGLTTGCAACHDHKFDPFTQKDHYSLAAFLGNTAEKPWDLNIAESQPVLRLPKPAMTDSATFILSQRSVLQQKLDVRLAAVRELTAAWLAAGHRPQAVPTQALQLRLRLDEGHGDVVKNSAPGATRTEFKATTNPLVWGENTWLWPSMRMDILSRINLGELGDVEADEAFSAGGWLMLRAKPGGGVRRGTGIGSLLSRMGDSKRLGGAGWELYFDGSRFTVNLVPKSEPFASTESEDDENEEAAPALPKCGISVTTRDTFLRDEWLHVFFTYSGTRKAADIKLYVNGEPVEAGVKLDKLRPKDSIRTTAAMQLGRRDDFQPMRETRFQDVRFYTRALAAREVRRLPFEDLAAEIVARQPDPDRWTTEEKFVVYDRFFLGETDEQARELKRAVDAHDAAFEALTVGGAATLIALEKPTPAFADILKRGDYFARVERVEPSVPHFLPPLPRGASADRRGLAEWLLAPEHPLMARVTVNRMWQELFGRGLVDSANDFGIMGDRPTHPDLLDWLAVEFRESGWDVKKFYRTLVLSSTYQQSAVATPDRLAKDASNKLLSRGPRFRMDGEMLRDSALATAGLLVEKIGGPSVKPYQPPGIWEEVAMVSSNTKSYVPDKGEGLYRRSLYTFWKRSAAPPSMETFDATSREVVCAKRARTNTPLQAFVTMNDPQWIEAARKLAERAVRSGPSVKSRIDFLARVTLSRSLDPEEEKTLAQAADTFRAKFIGKEENARDLLAVGESPADASIPAIELAQWTLVASQFLNLDEFLTK